MTVTLNRPPTRRTRPRPVATRRVPITVKPSAEERAQLRSDRISAALALLFIVALIAALVWAAVTGDASSTDAMWDYPMLY